MNDNKIYVYSVSADMYTRGMIIHRESYSVSLDPGGTHVSVLSDEPGHAPCMIPINSIVKDKAMFTSIVNGRPSYTIITGESFSFPEDIKDFINKYF